jgi:NAD+ diphosphatase
VVRSASMTTKPTPLAVHLPFNRDCLGEAFVPAKGHTARPPEAGHWLVVQGQSLVVREGNEPRLPTGERPGAFDGHLGRALWLGTLDGTPCWVAALPGDAPVPAGFGLETLVPMQGTRLSDTLLSLGGMALQALHWAGTSVHCPRCGVETEPIPAEWGKRCPRCGYEHYPHLHPAVIVLVQDRDRVLLTRKASWAPGRYSLVAGFVDNGECLEGAVHREVREEVGVEVTDLRYVGSQNWPFPSQLMIGFVARYAGGELAVDREELEDARWFPVDGLPTGPSRHSIARFILDHYARA